MRFRKSWLSVLICLTVLFSLVAYAFAADGERFVRVTAYDVNIRAGASTEHPVIGRADYGDSLIAITSENGWYQVRFGKEQTGWIHASLVKEGSRFQTANPSIQIAVANTADVNVRGGASTSYDVITVIGPGTAYPLLQTSGDWVQIRLPGERTGWVSRALVDVTEQKARPAAEEEQKKATVTADLLHVRQTASLDGAIVGKLSQNALVKVTGTADGWSQIEFAAASEQVIKGYVRTEYLRLPNIPAPNASQPPGVSGPQVKLLENANIRSGPGTNYVILQTGTSGATFPLTGRSGQWQEIELTDGRRAWVAGWLTEASGDLSGVPERGHTLDSELRGRTIVLDAGHGGIDVGAIGRTSGVQEKDLNLSLTRILYNKLLATGANVILTRPDDRFLGLDERVAVSEQRQADAFVSLHFNTHQDAALSGSMTFYYNQDGEDHRLAKLIQTELTQTLGLPDLGARFGDYYVLRENSQPAVLVEAAFLTHPGDEQTAQDAAAQERAAEGIFRALVTFLQTQKPS
ncbi:N-acetylmuramoyl-L-alanine amidase [Tumebacillus sp. DT12]|uniref:N-acetylmuramoyl-L-alanine amidase n=1 Tax=Tumebacillus lacus TaxID=2995335 RepID=A0ABT3X3X4_9BACL|nr:N-acetylmuramoyl-L-alanine amidase [Tumebacillus lacus]MCX7570321.1 N-acetylmuramoyl-L-alanine amidase [Tumebacillus lacus]